MDRCEHMVPAAEHWDAIAWQLLHATNGDCVRTGPSCSNKWNNLHAEFKKIKDYYDGTGTNSLYWELGPKERERMGLPKQFNCHLYDEMVKFFNERPIHNPGHIRDNLNPHDKNTAAMTLEEVLHTSQTEDTEPVLDSITHHGP